MFCKNCGNELKENEKFCGKCGSKIVDNTTNVTTNNIETKTNSKRPIKIKLIYIVIGVMLVSIFFGIYIAKVTKPKGLTTSTENVKGNYNNINENKIEDSSVNLPIYIGKTYVGIYRDITSYITFMSNNKFKYVSRYKYGNVPDIIMEGTYEIDGNSINSITVLQGGSIIRENYTIVDKNTIKSSTTTYTVSEN